jgi:Uma2 family endonuclease
VPTTRNTYRHGEILIAVGFVLKSYARTHPAWRVAGGDPGSKLARNPDVLRGPDVALVKAERWPSGKGAEGWLQGAPDLAVEIMGDDQTFSDLTRKALEYLSSGSRIVWVIDPHPRRVVVFTPPDHVRVLAVHDELDGGDLLDDFTCKVVELFE